MILAMSTFLQVLIALVVLAPIVILWIAAVADAFRSEHSGISLAATLVLILIFPIIGPLLYFIFRWNPAEPRGQVDS
jgi:hypothetical protein